MKFLDQAKIYIKAGNGGSGFLQKGGGVLCEGTPNSTFMNGAIFDNGRNGAAIAKQFSSFF